MRIIHLLVLVSAGLPPAVVRAQELPPLGRFVNVNPTDMQYLVLAFEADGQVHRLMPAPGFRARYEVEGERLELRTGDGSGASFTLIGDALTSDGRAMYTRVSGALSEAGGLVGTWRWVPGGSMDQFMTLRSDGQVILEVGFPVQASVNGDTLTIISDQLPAVSFVAYTQGDTLLHLQDAMGKNRLLLRRPWGCFGIEALDALAAECH